MRRVIFALMVIWLLGGGCQSPAPTPQTMPLNKSCGIMRFDVVAIYFSAQGIYKTTQQHTIDFDTKRLIIQANEPEGTVTAAYQQGRFSTQGLNFSRTDQLPFGMFNAAMAEMLFYLFDVPVYGIRHTDVQPTTEWFLGKTYQTYRLTDRTAGRVVIYQHPQSGQLQFVEWNDKKEQRYLAVPNRWRFIPALNRQLPTKVEFYDIRRSPADKRLMVQLLFTPIL